jgi:hypothetical protein
VNSGAQICLLQFGGWVKKFGDVDLTELLFMDGTVDEEGQALEIVAESRACSASHFEALFKELHQRPGLQSA